MTFALPTWATTKNAETDKKFSNTLLFIYREQSWCILKNNFKMFPFQKLIRRPTWYGFFRLALLIINIPVALIGQKFCVWVTSIHHIYFPSSHLPSSLPPKGNSSFIFSVQQLRNYFFHPASFFLLLLLLQFLAVHEKNETYLRNFVQRVIKIHQDVSYSASLLVHLKTHLDFENNKCERWAADRINEKNSFVLS